MAKYTKGKVEALLEEGRVGLGNAQSTPEILALLTSLNYDEAKLQEGHALFKTLDQQNAAQLRLYAQQREATAAFNAARSAANKTYSRHIKITRALLAEEPERLARLGLEGKRANAFGAWLEQARQFYREGLADDGLQAALAEGGLSQEVLRSGQTLAETAAQANSAQESAKGMAQQSTQDRNAAATTFEQWMRKFWKIAEVALSDQPQWMERLGRMERS